MKQNIAALILTAGASSRMGQPKALLRWTNGTLLEHIIEVVQDTGIDKIALVTGAHHKDILAAFPSYQNSICHNSEWKSGMGGSIREGVTQLRNKYPDLTGILILLIDQPLIHSIYLKEMIAHLETGTFKIVASKFNNTAGAPALFDRSYFDRLTQLPLNEGAKALINNGNAAVCLLDAHEIALDVDTPLAYEQLKNKYDFGESQ